MLSNHDGSRLAALWAMVGISTWTDIAGLMASIYSLILIIEWIYKRVKHNKTHHCPDSDAAVSKEIDPASCKNTDSR